MILFVWLLPFHSFAIALLFGLVGISSGTARTIAAWKEMAVVALLAWVIARALRGRGERTPIALSDVAVGVLIGLAALFLIAQDPLFRAEIPGGAQLYAFRDDVFFLLLYYVGRATPEIAESETVIKNIFMIALVVSVIGILERIFVSPEMLVVLGVASYQSDFLGLSSYTAGNEFGLPINYWTWMGGVPVRRAGSVFLHSQGFALPFLLLMPAATAWAFNRERKRTVLVRLAYLVIWLGFALTITRMTIVICLAQVAVLFVLLRRPQKSVGMIALISGAVVITMALVPSVLRFVWDTLTFQTASSESHLRDWSAGLLAFFARPWGNGLGTTDAPPVRFGLSAISSDNMYLSYAVQLGLAGFVALMTALGSFAAMAWRATWWARTETERQFAAVMFVTVIGILVNGATSTVFSSNMLAYVFAWQAGALVTMASAIE